MSLWPTTWAGLMFSLWYFKQFIYQSTYNPLSLSVSKHWSNPSIFSSIYLSAVDTAANFGPHLYFYHLYKPFKLLLEPVPRGSGNEWYDKISIGLPFFSAFPVPDLSVLPAAFLSALPAAALSVFLLLSLTFDLLSTRMRVNSTFLRSSTATIMSLKMATSSPWRLRSPSNETRGPIVTRIVKNFWSGFPHHSLVMRPAMSDVRAWEKQTSRLWRISWLSVTASFCCWSLTMLQAENKLARLSWKFLIFYLLSCASSISLV